MQMQNHSKYHVTPEQNISVKSNWLPSSTTSLRSKQPSRTNGGYVLLLSHSITTSVSSESFQLELRRSLVSCKEKKNFKKGTLEYTLSKKIIVTTNNVQNSACFSSIRRQLFSSWQQLDSAHHPVGRLRSLPGLHGYQGRLGTFTCCYKQRMHQRKYHIREGESLHGAI